MADAGVDIRLNPAYPDYAANNSALLRRTSIPIGTTWEKRNYFGHQPNVPGGPNNAGGGATAAAVITANGVTMSRLSWLDARPEFLAELGRLIASGKVIATDIGTGIPLTAEEVHVRDLPEPVQQAAGVVAVNGDPAANGDGVDVRGYGFVARVTPTVVPADATFQLWVFQRTDDPAPGDGLWSAVGDPVQVNTNQSTLIEVSSEVQALASRAYIEVSVYASGTWTLDIVRRSLVDRA